MIPSPSRAVAAASRRTGVISAAALVLTAMIALPSSGRDRPFGTSTLFLEKWAPKLVEMDLGVAGQTDAGGQFSKVQIEGFRCTSLRNPVHVRGHELQYIGLRSELRA